MASQNHAHLHANSGEGLPPAARGGGRYCAAADLSGWFGHPARAAAILPDYKASPTALDTDIFAIYPPTSSVP